jgi:hypothetical protein
MRVVPSLQTIVAGPGIGRIGTGNIDGELSESKDLHHTWVGTIEADPMMVANKRMRAPPTLWTAEIICPEKSVYLAASVDNLQLYPRTV